MKTIALQDANILIDLIQVGLFDHCLSLNYRFITTDIILVELHDHQSASIQPHINSGKFEIISIDETALMEIQLVAAEDTRLSVQDWSALVYAQKLNALLLTGDKRLRSIAQAKGLTVCGLLWILDELVVGSGLSKREAHDFLKELQVKNKRLPAEECKKRLKDWEEE